MSARSFIQTAGESVWCRTGHQGSVFSTTRSQCRQPKKGLHQDPSKHVPGQQPLPEGVKCNCMRSATVLLAYMDEPYSLVVISKVPRWRGFQTQQSMRCIKAGLASSCYLFQYSKIDTKIARRTFYAHFFGVFAQFCVPVGQMSLQRWCKAGAG